MKLTSSMKIVNNSLMGAAPLFLNVWQSISSVRGATVDASSVMPELPDEESKLRTLLNFRITKKIRK